MIDAPSCKNGLSGFKNLSASLIYGIANGALFGLQFILSDFIKPRSIETILFFRTGSLGDIICAIPAFRSVRKSFPSSKILLLTDANRLFNDSQNLTSVIGADIFDEIIYYKAEDLSGVRRVLLLLHRIKRHKIDAMVYLGQYDLSLRRIMRDMLFFSFSGCRRLYGFRLNKHRFFRIAQRYNRLFHRESQRLLLALRPLGINEQELDFVLPISRQDKEFVDKLLFESGSSNQRLIAAINPGSKFPVNLWPKENFLQLAKELVDKYNVFIVIIGGSDARDTCGFIADNLGKRCLNLCGRTSFMQSAELLFRCKFLVSCDSGPVHLAAAVNTPVVGIYTARDYPNCWYPWGRQHSVIRHDLACQVCFKTTCQTSNCIKGISVNEVLGACVKILE